MVKDILEGSFKLGSQRDRAMRTVRGAEVIGSFRTLDVVVVRALVDSLTSDIMAMYSYRINPAFDLIKGQ